MMLSQNEDINDIHLRNNQYNHPEVNVMYKLKNMSFIFTQKFYVNFLPENAQVFISMGDDCPPLLPPIISCANDKR